MKNIKIIISILFILFLFFNSCKSVTSDNPIDAKTKLSADEALPGIWYGLDSKEKIHVLIRIRRDGYLDITGADSSFKYDEGKIFAYPSYLGEERFLNINATTNDSQKLDLTKNFLFLHYQVKNNNNTIELRNMKFDFFVDAVTKKLIKGEVKYSTSRDKKTKVPADVILSDTSENIRKFLKENNKENYLENKVMILNRVK
jgi:hypothetical protein